MKKSRIWILLSFLLLLSACTTRGELRHMVLEADELDRIEKKKLSEVDLSGSTCYDAILAWSEAHPDVTVHYTVALPDGTEARNDASALDLSAYGEEERAAAVELFRFLPALREVELGSDAPALSLSDARALADRFPDITFRYRKDIGGLSASLDSEALDLSAYSGDFDLLCGELSALRELRSLSLGSAFRPEEITALRERFADAEIDGCVELLGTPIPLDADTLDLSAASREELAASADALSCLRSVKELRLGHEREGFGWEGVALVTELFPDAALDYSFTLFDRACTLDDTEWIFKLVPMNDRGDAVRAALPYMKKLSYLRMDRCGVESEDMARLRDDFPDIKVVWRVFFGSSFTCLTDVETILASSASRGGNLNVTNTEELKYCTEVRYLDIGHQISLVALPFCAYMPKLEVLIAGLGAVRDLSGLSNCQKLRVLELYKSDVGDLTPLKGLKGLTDLNVSCINEIEDLSPLFEMKQLKYVMVGATKAPKEQIAALKEALPDCEVNDWCQDGKSGWRGIYENGEFFISDRYAEMRRVFDYDHRMYALAKNDPEY